MLDAINHKTTSISHEASPTPIHPRHQPWPHPTHRVSPNLENCNSIVALFFLGSLTCVLYRTSLHLYLYIFCSGGKGMPKMYGGYFDEQIAKQASTAVGKAIAAGKKNMEVQFPAVPNVEEAKFGTPLK